VVGSCHHTDNFGWVEHKENLRKLQKEIGELESLCFDEATGILSDLRTWDEQNATDNRLGKALLRLPADAQNNLRQLLLCCENNIAAINAQRKEMDSPFVLFYTAARRKEFAAKEEKLLNLKNSATKLCQLRSELDDLLHLPGKNRLRHLQSLFCVPLTISLHDFGEFFSTQPNPKPLDTQCTALLLTKQHSLFVEPIDFAQPSERSVCARRCSPTTGWRMSTDVPPCCTHSRRPRSSRDIANIVRHRRHSEVNSGLSPKSASRFSSRPERATWVSRCAA
jgi:hypothetical protein